MDIRNNFFPPEGRSRVRAGYRERLCSPPLEILKTIWCDLTSDLRSSKRLDQRPPYILSSLKDSVLLQKSLCSVSEVCKVTLNSLCTRMKFQAPFTGLVSCDRAMYASFSYSLQLSVLAVSAMSSLLISSDIEYLETFSNN